VRVGIRNRGAYDFGHYDLHTVEKIAKVSEDLFGYPFYDVIRTDQYVSTNERFGIQKIQVPDDIISTKPPKALSDDLSYLAKRQGLPYPALPINTEQERKLYNSLIAQGIFDPESLCQEFNLRADGETIFFKSPSHITSYKTIYKRALNRKRTMNEIDLEDLHENFHATSEKLDFPQANSNSSYIVAPDTSSLQTTIQMPAQITELIYIAPSVSAISNDQIIQNKVRGTDKRKRAPRKCAICNLTKEDGCKGSGGKKFCERFTKNHLIEGMDVFLYHPEEQKFIGNAVVSQLVGEVHSIQLEDDQISLRSFELSELVDGKLELPIHGYLSHFSELTSSTIWPFPLKWIRIR
jgi:hypothetical protein